RGSNGFFSYRIQPRADLELPFIVTNRAGIYFDFNEPIITNTVLHTVDTGFIEGPNSVSRISRAIANLQVSPNPSPSGRFDVDIETARPGPFMLRLSDQLGRTVRTHEQVDKQSSLDYSKLPNGVYYLSAFDQNGLWLVTKQIIR
ncbi:MAG: T9SS type A sorting domain-containing protein, partial [Bacteroidota bacterium]